MSTLQTLVNIALNKPAYRERALHQLRRNADKFHAMEVEREVEDFECHMKHIRRGINWRKDSLGIMLHKATESEIVQYYQSELVLHESVYDVLLDIHLSKKNGALA